jgi:hypothetical protein
MEICITTAILDEAGMETMVTAGFMGGSQSFARDSRKESE